MLQAMQQTAPAAPSPASPTFAGILAALASRPSGPPGRAPAWNDSELADDVATLSYERALRTHARYRAPELTGSRLGPSADAPAAEEAVLAAAEPASAVFRADAAEEAGMDAAAEETAAADEGNRKSASITIRLSRTECKQLRKRAAEAGLTVSAYLRSCTFEAESLRAMVKDTLAQLRNEPARDGSAHATGNRRGWREWLGRLWVHPRAAHVA
jgi:predicted DNA binding CopG/RHH family protein